MRFDESSQKSRACRLVVGIAVILAIGIAYYAIWRVTGIGIPCVFERVTGVYCPGCGISRMFAAMLRLDFKAAIGANVFVFCLLPFAGAVAIFKAIRYIRSGVTSDPLWLNVIYVIALIASIVFWILRNIPEFAYLAPH